MDELLQTELNTSKLINLGSSGGGCISVAQSYETDQGKIFVKTNSKSEARRMFEGEYASLLAISETNTIKVPQPIKVIDLPDQGAAIVMEYLDLSPGLSRFATTLGQQLASLHLNNCRRKTEREKKESSVHTKGETTYVDKYGFHVPTCCGYLAQSNNWETNWIKFYCTKLEEQISLAESQHGDRKVRELWNVVLLNINKLFINMDIQPALLHGDLWGGNTSQTTEGPVIFDPASFYGHTEYDLAISHMFGGFPTHFFTEYHKIIPKSDGHTQRQQLYELFHYLNHWNHFGGGYRNSSLSILKILINYTK